LVSFMIMLSWPLSCGAFINATPLLARNRLLFLHPQRVANVLVFVAGRWSRSFLSK
jgi:hypothetical protein